MFYETRSYLFLSNNVINNSILSLYKISVKPNYVQIL